MPAAATIAIATIGSAYITSQSQKKSASRSADIAAESAAAETAATEAMYEQGRTDLEPYRRAGTSALEQLTGQRTEYWRGLPDESGEWVTADELGWKPTEQQLAGMRQRTVSTDGVDPTGGAEEWISDIRGVDKYISQLEGLEWDFKLDEDDPVYKWRQAENTRQVNQFFASRGGYDSRAAANILTQSGMQLQEQEVTRQYNQYNQRYLAKYNKLIDLANLKTSQATTGYNMAMQAGTARTNKLQNIASLGQAAAAQTAASGTQTANQLVGISQVESQQRQNALAQSTAAKTGLWTALGEAPANYLAYRSLLQNL